MSDDESFIEESDGDGTPPQWRKNKDEKVLNTVLPESDDEFGDEDDEVPAGRMTPSIKRAIRRSILNMSRMADSDEEEEDEEEEDDEEIENGDESHERSNKIEISDSDSDDFIPTQKKRGNRISDSSDDDNLPEKSTRHSLIPRKSLQKSSNSNSNGHLDLTSDEASENQHKTPRNTTSHHITSLLDSTEDEHEEDPDSGRGSNPKTSKRTSESHQKTPHFASFHADRSYSSSGSQHSTIKKSNSSRQSESLTIENPSSDEEKSPPPKPQPKSVPKEPQIRPEFIISSSDEESQHLISKTLSKPSEIISLDSDSPSDSEPHSKSIGESTAMSFAQQELDGLNNLDPVLAQRRALLVIELQKRELELLKIRQFLASRKQHLLPDKGQKLLGKAVENEEAIEDLRKQIAKCRLVEPDVSGELLESSRDDSVLRENDSAHDNSVKVVGGARQDPDYMPYDSEDDSPKAKPSAFNNGIFNRPTTAPIGKLGKKARETYEMQQDLTVETLKSFHGSLTSCPAENEQAEDPRGLKVSLMGHQKHALAWLLWREHQKPPGGVLADDMGLGKTLTMISLILKSMEAEDSGGESDEGWYSKQKSSKPTGGTLVVCPASLIGQWEDEVKRRCKKGLLNVELYHGSKRENVPKRLARNDMVITTYNLLSREHKMNQVLFRIKWKRVILDEGHIIRNHKSQVCEAVCALEAQKRWILTGTPIHNKGMDLYSVLKFLQCSPFNDIRVWKRWVDNKNSAGHERLATVMKTLLLRRTKQELMSSGAVENLPEKSFEIKWVELNEEERLVYDKVMMYSRTIFAQFLHQRAEKEHMFKMGAAGYYERPMNDNANPFNKAQQRLLAQHAPPDDVKAHHILTLFLRLRQICCHPSLIHAMLDKEEIEQTGFDDNEMDMTRRMGQMKIGGFDGDEEVPDGPAEVDERVAEHLLTSDNPVFERSRESSKLKAVLELLENILEKDEKVIIVSQWTSVLDIIAENLKKIKRATFKSLTGAIQVKDRGAIVDSFNHERDPKVLLLSLTAGGVGLNLVGANHLMLVDIHWNPQLESQAQDRIYRFGQKKNVFIYKFLCTDTIEEKIKAMQDHKLALAKNILSGSGKSQSVKLTMDDLRSIFGL